MKVIAFVHQNPSDIPSGKSESSSDSINKLKQFRDKVTKDRLVKFWNNANELPGLVALSLTKTIKMYPAIGWVRANQVSNEELLIELNQLRKENKKILEKNSRFANTQSVSIENIADINSLFKIHGFYKLPDYNENIPWTTQISWKEIFVLISPYLIEQPIDYKVKNYLINDLNKLREISRHQLYLDDQIFKTIRIQLQAYGLINTMFLARKDSSNTLSWSLTEKGEQFMIESRVVRCVPSEN